MSFKKRFIEIGLVLQDLLSFKVDDLEFYQQLILTAIQLYNSPLKT